MAIKINERTAYDYETKTLDFAKIGMPVEYIRALARAYKRDFPVEFRAFAEAYSAGQRQVNQEYEPEIFRNFLGGLAQPALPIAEPIANLLGQEIVLPQPKTLGEEVAFGTGSLVTLVLVLLLLLLTVWHKIVRWMKL